MTVKTVDTTMSNETGACKKCTTDIPLKAERCPQCGYEPGKAVLGPIGTIIGIILLIGAIFQILVGVLSLLTVFVGVPITGALIGAAIFIGAGAIQGIIADWIGKFGTHYAAEQPDETTLQEESKSFKEEMQEASEQGRERGERWQQNIIHRIDQLSPWVFTSTIIAGIVLVFFSVGVTSMETELAGVPTEDIGVTFLILSFFVFPFTVYADVRRVNRLYNTDHKWWLWTFLSMIPFIGFIPALAWVWRRRSTEYIDREQTPPKTTDRNVET